MALLGKDQILSADDTQYEDVSVPEWGGEVRIRGLSGTEVDKYEASLMRMRHGKPDVALQNATARLIAWCAIDENGSRLFVHDDEVRELGKKSGVALQRCFDAAAKLSGLREGDVEAMVENFDGPQSGSSTSG